MSQGKSTLSVAAGVLAMFVGGCGVEQGDTDQVAANAQAASSDFQLDGDAERGRELYARNCASCHGNKGRGDGPVARALNPPAADLTEVNDAERAFKTTRDGGMAVGLAPTMPPFKGAMDDQAIHDVVAYILTLEK